MRKITFYHFSLNVTVIFFLQNKKCLIAFFFSCINYANVLSIEYAKWFQFLASIFFVKLRITILKEICLVCLSSDFLFWNQTGLYIKTKQNIGLHTRAIFSASQKRRFKTHECPWWSVIGYYGPKILIVGHSNRGWIIEKPLETPCQ